MRKFNFEFRKFNAKDMKGFNECRCICETIAKHWLFDYLGMDYKTGETYYYKKMHFYWLRNLFNKPSIYIRTNYKSPSSYGMFFHSEPHSMCLGVEKYRFDIFMIDMKEHRDKTIDSILKVSC